MKSLLKYKRIYLLGLIPISLILIFVAKNSSFFTEQIYAKYIYRWIAQIISTITGILPFSIAELLIIILPAAVLVILSRFILGVVLEKTHRMERFLKGILNLLCAVSVLFFSFTILAGLNYYRYPFSSYSDLEIVESTVEELYALTESLALQANELREQIPCTNDAGIFQLSKSTNELAEEANKAYELLSEDYSILSGSYGSPKPVLMSELMSRTEITGIFIPFTMEANVNIHVPDYTIPATMLHELAHLRGFMREDEANYLAYLAGMASEDIEFRYSSTMQALVISGNALYDQDSDMYFRIRELYSEAVIMDLRENNEYWQQYEDTVVSTVSNKINDTYLKANNQTDGVQSYGRMLDLLLAQYRKDHETTD